MNGKKRGSVALWVLAALLLVVDIIALAMGVSSVQAAGEGPSWHMTAGEITVTPIDGEQVYDYSPARDYYELTFQLTNNSTRAVPLASYWMNARPVQGDKYAARLAYDDSSIQYRLDPVVPMGASGAVRLTLAVRPDQMKGNKVDLSFDAYGSDKHLGTISLP